MDTNQVQQLTATFEGHAQQTETGTVYWLARDVQHLLGYSKWENFQTVIAKAKTACEVSGHTVENHFPDVRKMVSIGSGTQREVEDVMLTRYACYLIARTGDLTRTRHQQRRRAPDPPQPRHPPRKPASRRGFKKSRTPPDLRREEGLENPRHPGRRMSRKKSIPGVPVAHSGVTDSRIRDCGDSLSQIDPKAGKVKTRSRPKPAASLASDDYRNLLDDLATVIAPLQALHRQAVEAHAPIVREILSHGSRDPRVIEHTLDHLLDHACIPQGLALFKSLCRHYWEINPHATASYINAYREMWDSNDRET